MAFVRESTDVTDDLPEVHDIGENRRKLPKRMTSDSLEKILALY